MVEFSVSTINQLLCQLPDLKLRQLVHLSVRAPILEMGVWIMLALLLGTALQIDTIPVSAVVREGGAMNEKMW